MIHKHNIITVSKLINITKFPYSNINIFFSYVKDKIRNPKSQY